MTSISSATSHAISHQAPPSGAKGPPQAPPPVSAKPAASAKSASALDIEA